MTPDETRRETAHDDVPEDERPWVDRKLKRLIPTLTVMRRLVLLVIIVQVVLTTLVIVMDDANDKATRRIDTNARQGGQAICFVQFYASAQASNIEDRIAKMELPDSKQTREARDSLQKLANDMHSTGVNCSDTRQGQRKEQQEGEG